MGSVTGRNLIISVFGESHGAGLGVNIDGFPSGVSLDLEQVAFEMSRRAPKKTAYSTARNEDDLPEIISGVLDNKTTGAPICAVFRNKDARSSDYSDFSDIPRPSHADYTASLRYNKNNDIRGGGHFSGRLTAPVVFAGALCRQYLKSKNVVIGAHIEEIGGIKDSRFSDMTLTFSLLDFLSKSDFPVMSLESNKLIHKKIEDAASSGDSLGGVVECAVLGFPAGIGSPMFGGVESVLSSMLFSVPAVKGVEFGAGFGISRLPGSEANDAFCLKNGRVATGTNNNGGINGGITNGMPIIVRAAIKPVPSIAKEQETLNLKTMEQEKLIISGRHDACIVPRAVTVIESSVAIALTDLLLEATGYANA